MIAGSGGPDLDPALVAGVPVVAEPSSSLWSHATRTGAVAARGAELRPDQVVVVGRPTLHRPVTRLLADPRVAVYAAANPHGEPWTDVSGAVRAVGAVPPLRPPRAFRDAGAPPTRPRRPRWTPPWTAPTAGPAWTAGPGAPLPGPPGCGWPATWSPPSRRGPRWCSARRTRCATWRSRPYRGPG